MMVDFYDLLYFEPISKEFLDDNLRYVRTTEQGLVQYNNKRDDRFFFERNYDFSTNGFFYDICFVVKRNK